MSTESTIPFTTVPEDDTRLLDSLGVRTIHHPYYERCFDRVMRSIRLAYRDGFLTLVLAPSRVGKSRLRSEVERALRERYADHAKPIKASAAPETGSVGFSPNGFFSSMLIALGDKAPDRHTITTSRVPNGLHPLGHTKTGNAKLFALLQYLRRVRPAAVIVDEAGYLADGSVRERLAIMRDLTWVAENSKVPFVLFGTYDGLDLLNVKEDVNARIRFRHLARYDDTVRGRRAFHQALVAFDEELLRVGVLAADGFRLQSEPRFIYNATHGRFGLVFTLVDLGCDIAQERGRMLRLADLKEAKADLMGDALGFGAKTREQEKLALRIERAAADSGSSPTPSDDSQPEPTPIASADSTRTRRVGERKVVRDAAFAAVKVRQRSA